MREHHLDAIQQHHRGPSRFRRLDAHVVSRVQALPVAMHPGRQRDLTGVPWRSDAQLASAAATRPASGSSHPRARGFRRYARGWNLPFAPTASELPPPRGLRPLTGGGTSPAFAWGPGPLLVPPRRGQRHRGRNGDRTTLTVSALIPLGIQHPRSKWTPASRRPPVPGPTARPTLPRSGASEGAARRCASSGSLATPTSRQTIFPT